MVAEEEVFAVLRAILMPILAGYLDGRSLGVFVHRVLYVVLGEKVKDLLTAKKVLVAHIIFYLSRRYA
jgi:hypothetical protein